MDMLLRQVGLRRIAGVQSTLTVLLSPIVNDAQYIMIGKQLHITS